MILLSLPKTKAMKKILHHAILAGLFLLMTSGVTSFALADDEGTPSPSEGTPDIQEQQDPAEPLSEEINSDTETDTNPIDVVPLEPLAEPVTDPAEETSEYEVIPTEVTEPVTPEIETETTPVEPTATTDPTPAVAVADPQAIAAKVIVVDRAANTMTIEVNGKLQLVNITPQVRILNKGKLVTLDDITSGQSIVLLARPLDNGTYEVVSVAIGPAKGQAQAAGNGKALGVGWGQRVKDNPPFFNFPNPANSLGPVVSPNN